MAPDDGVGVIAFTNGTRNGMLWIPTEVSLLVTTLLGVPDDAIRADVPQRPEIWSDLCGWYYLPGRFSDARMRGMVGVGVEVFVRGGRLFLRGLTPVPAIYRGYRLHPDDEQDPYAFRIDLSELGLGTIRVVFGRDPERGTMAVHLDVMPVSAFKRSAAANPRLWTQGAVAVGATSLLGRRRLRSRRERPAA